MEPLDIEKLKELCESIPKRRSVEWFDQHAALFNQLCTALPQALATIAELQKQLEQAEREASVRGHRKPCYYCGEPCNDLAANPGKWSIPLCHVDDPGVVKYHHIGCVSRRLHERDALQAEIAGLRADALLDPIVADTLRHKHLRIKSLGRIDVVTLVTTVILARAANSTEAGEGKEPAK